MFKFRTFVYCFNFQHPRKIKRYSYISSALFWVLNSKPYFWISISQSALIIIFFICHLWISLTALHRQVGYNNKFKQAGRWNKWSQTIRRVVTCLLTQPLAIWLAASGIHSQTKIQYVVWLFSFKVRWTSTSRERANKDTTKTTEAFPPPFLFLLPLFLMKHIQSSILRFSNNSRNVSMNVSTHTDTPCPIPSFCPTLCLKIQKQQNVVWE